MFPAHLLRRSQVSFFGRLEMTSSPPWWNGFFYMLLNLLCSSMHPKPFSSSVHDLHMSSAAEHICAADSAVLIRSEDGSDSA